MLKERYVNPFTDFGFKRIFGTEANKDILINFLNNILDGRDYIKTLSFKNTEHLGNLASDRRAIFDLYCENEKGEKFIIELQKSKQQFFKERSLYYATFPIREMAERGSWNFDLKAVYLVGILDFVFDEDKHSRKYKHDIKLMDIESNKIFYDKLRFIYLEMPKFKKKEADLETEFDKWMYILKFLPDLQERPKILKNKIFKKLFDIAELANFNIGEYNAYEDSLKSYRDLNNVMDTAKKEAEEKGMAAGLEQGIAKGIEQGIATGIEQGRGKEKIQIARLLKSSGIGTDVIAKSTGLSQSEIDKL